MMLSAEYQKKLFRPHVRQHIVILQFLDYCEFSEITCCHIRNAIKSCSVYVFHVWLLLPFCQISTFASALSSSGPAIHRSHHILYLGGSMLHEVGFIVPDKFKRNKC